MTQAAKAPAQKRLVALSTAAPTYYDAASTTNERDFSPWVSTVFEDAQFTGTERYIAVSRLRREVRNNPYLSGLVNKFPEAIGCSTMRSRTSDKDYNDVLDKWWFDWSNGPVTLTGETLRAFEMIVWPELLLGGELFVVFLRNGQVQLMPTEFCGSPRANIALTGGAVETNGIRYDASGVPTHYRFGRLNDWGGVDFSDSTSTLVPAQFVRHIYRKDRVMMGRGLPWLLPCVTHARDLYELVRAKTKQIKDVASVFGFLYKKENTGGLGSLQPFQGLDAATGKPVAETTDAAADVKPTTVKRIELKPGTFIELEPGEELRRLNEAYQATDYKELVMMMLHAISTPVKLPVELWFSGLGDVNYSGFKGLGTQWAESRRGYIQFIREALHMPLYRWRVSKAISEGDVPRNPDGDINLVDWLWKRAAMLDDEKQAKCAQIRLDSGESCLADFWEENGAYAEEELAKRRQLYIKALVASGDLSPDADFSTVKVPVSFLLANTVPGAVKKPAVPDNTGNDNNAEIQENTGGA
jgi:capsid protein